MENVYYSPKGFWKGNPAIKRLAREAKVSDKEALEFLWIIISRTKKGL